MVGVVVMEGQREGCRRACSLQDPPVSAVGFGGEQVESLARAPVRLPKRRFVANLFADFVGRVIIRLDTFGFGLIFRKNSARACGEFRPPTHRPRERIVPRERPPLRPYPHAPHT